MNKKYPIKLKWKCHTPNLLKEINNCTNFNNPTALRIFRDILVDVSERASEINDPKLNALMCRLTLYEIADPESKNYDSKLLNKTLKKGDLK